MSIRPVRAAKPGPAALWSVTFAATAALLSLTPYAATAAGDDAPGVLTKMASLYNNAKSYQATIVSKESGKTKDGKAFTVITTQEIRYKAPNMFFVSMKKSGTGAAAGKNPNGTPMLDTGRTIFNSDGKTVTRYAESRNLYDKQAAPATLPLAAPFSLLQKLPGPKAPGISLGSSTTYAGRPAFVILVKPIMPANLSAADQKKWQDVAKDAQPLHMMVDRQNYQLLGLNETAKGGSLEITVNSQTINGNISANAFSFAPPAGSKEAPKAPTQSGGATGLPR